MQFHDVAKPLTIARQNPGPAGAITALDVCADCRRGRICMFGIEARG